jgi:hypothetical protein
MRRLLVLVGCLWAAGAGVAAQNGDEDRVSVELLLGRAGWYVADFLEKFSNVVSEETYLQDSSVPLQSAMVIGRPGAASRNRVLKSDFLLVSVNSAREWVPFRDVFEMDGQPIRDRQQRLARLFLKQSPDSLDQASIIQEESARYNLGNMRRTINNPVLGLAVVEAEAQSRFRYSLGKIDRKVGPDVWTIEYQEVTPPAFVRGRSNIDLFAHGRVWIEPDSGRILKTEVLLEQPSLRARVTTSFRFDDRFGIAVPYQMQEEYKFDNGTRVTAIATYSRFRRFDVSTDEAVKRDDPSGTPDPQDEQSDKIKD